MSIEGIYKRLIADLMALVDSAKPEIVEFRDLESLGFPGYGVSSNGVVWSCRRNNPRGRGLGRGSRGGIGDKWKPLSPGGRTKKGRGHLQVSMVSKDGKIRSYPVHIIVLLVFVGPRPEGMNGCHNNDNPFDNRLSNLRWDTVSANRKDAYRNGGRGRRYVNNADC